MKAGNSYVPGTEREPERSREERSRLEMKWARSQAQSQAEMDLMSERAESPEVVPEFPEFRKRGAETRAEGLEAAEMDDPLTEEQKLRVGTRTMRTE